MLPELLLFCGCICNLPHVVRATAILRVYMYLVSCCPGYCRYTLYCRLLFFVMRCKLSANAGACLSLKGELAQEHERIDACDE